MVIRWLHHCLAVWLRLIDVDHWLVWLVIYCGFLACQARERGFDPRRSRHTVSLPLIDSYSVGKVLIESHPGHWRDTGWLFPSGRN